MIFDCIKIDFNFYDHTFHVLIEYQLINSYHIILFRFTIQSLNNDNSFFGHCFLILFQKYENIKIMLFQKD